MQRIAALSVAIVWAACSLQAPEPSLVDPGVGVQVQLSDETLDFTAIGATRSLHATVLDAEGTPVRNARISWSSTDPSVASVDGSGLVTALSRGRADIVATHVGIAAKAHVRVLPPPPGLAEIGIVPDEPTLTFIGQSIPLRALALDTEGQPLAEVLASWEVDDPSIASVDRLGTLEAVGVGTTRVKATILDGSLSTETSITVRPRPSSLLFLDDPSPTTAGAPQPAPIRVEARDAGGHPVQTPGLAVELEAVYGEDLRVPLGSAPLEEGVATFDGLVLQKAGSPVRLMALHEKVVGLSPTFSIGHAEPEGLGFFDLPPTLEARVPQAVRVGVVDAFGNFVPSESADVRLVARSLDPPELVLTGLGGAPTEEGFAQFVIEADRPGRVVLAAEADGWKAAADLSLRARYVFTSLDAGETHGCGLLRSGEALCFGENESGQLGSPDSSPVLVPTPTLGGTTFLSIAAAKRYGCGISSEGEALCWGAVPGRREPSPERSEIRLPASPLAIATGADHACLLTEGGTAHCFGQNAHGQLGDGSLEAKLEPVEIETPPLTALAAGEGFTCGLAEDGTPWCWGKNDEGQLGGASTAAFESRPVALPELALVSLTLGAAHACGLDPDGRVHCWGRFAQGQLGDGLHDGGGPAPRLVASELRFLRVAAGSDHSCAITDDERLVCWGSDDADQIGNAALDEDFTALPLPVDTPFESARFLGVTAGARHGCALEVGGAAYCWGKGEGGRLGTGDEDDRAHPTPVEGTQP